MISPSLIFAIFSCYTVFNYLLSEVPYSIFQALPFRPSTNMHSLVVALACKRLSSRSQDMGRLVQCDQSSCLLHFCITASRLAVQAKVGCMGGRKHINYRLSRITLLPLQLQRRPCSNKYMSWSHTPVDK